MGFDAAVVVHALQALPQGANVLQASNWILDHAQFKTRDAAMSAGVLSATPAIQELTGYGALDDYVGFVPSCPAWPCCSSATKLSRAPRHAEGVEASNPADQIRLQRRLTRMTCGQPLPKT